MREPLPSPEEIANLPKDGGDAFNRLVFESSPYLRQHARNPIQWYPWGKQALTRAREEQKPIFLSIGYSTCHWCHVMEKDSFENRAVADLLNTRYIPIKVDREERPDLDRVYMKATQVLTGRGGWPNSLWLTPESEPFYAGTYFPSEDTVSGANIRPGFLTILDRLATFWEGRQDDAVEQAQRIVEAISKHDSSVIEGSGKPNLELLDAWFERMHANLDPVHGGFTEQGPKFPPHATLRLMLLEAKNEFALELAAFKEEAEENETSEEAEDVFEPSGGPAWLALRTTLDAMARGGIYDHVGGGFHRYSTDERWFAPHFEKMLSDNAQLAAIYADAYRLGKDPEHGRIARSVVQWILRELKDEDEGFHSAIDADSDGEEGKYYVWTAAEILDVLGPTEAELYSELYGIEDDGNWHDEASGEKHTTNIPHLKRSLEDEAASRNRMPDDLIAQVQSMNTRLLEQRTQRPWPIVDDKVLSGWNGLAISALAKAGSTLEIEGFIESARLAGSFVTRKLIEADKFYATYRSGSARLEAYLDDYAFVANGLLDLYSATRAKRWLETARRLADWMIERFYSEDHGFYFTSHDHEELIIRTIEPTDGATPSGAGVAAIVLLRLGRLDRNKKYVRIAEATINHFGGTMTRFARGTETLLEALYMQRDIEKNRSETEQEAFPRGDIQLAVEPIRLSAYMSTRATRPDQNVFVALRIVIESKFHLPAFEGTEEALSPTTLRLIDESAFKLEQLEASPPEKRSVGGESIIVHSDDLWVLATLKSTAGIPEDRYTLHFEFQFQACDDERCLQKETMSFKAPVTLEVGAPKGINRHKEIFDRFFWKYRQR
jgi:uncharacterized protein YyaL (SSP411 family)